MEIDVEAPDFEPGFHGSPEPFHAIAFHGFSEATPHSTWIRVMQEFFARLGSTPTLARINLKTERFLSFRSFEARYVRNGKIDVVGARSVALFLEDDGGPTVRLDFPIAADVYRKRAWSDGSFIWRARESVKLVDLFDAIAREVLAISDAPYGYAFRRDARFGPAAYVSGDIMGMSRGPEMETDAIERIGAWAREHWPERATQRYRTSMIRDVYRSQLLSRSHLDATVFGSSLRAWIEARPERGVIEELAENRFLWTVAGTHLLDTREDLASSGILISEGRSWDI